MRVGRKTFAVNLLTESPKLFFADAAFEERARVDARRRMALEID
jgi:hypothetical protein